MGRLGAERWRVLLDRYELRERVGAGGMGEVWLGWDRRLRRDVAVKLLLLQLSAEPSFRRRFEVEARAAAALDHPNVVDVYDIDDDGGSLFIVMERLPGPSLDRRLAAGPMSVEEVRRLAVDLLSGLAAAHAAHLVHRDVKPGNLIRSAGGRWKLGDFGVAKDLAATSSLTMVGVTVGTPAYLAPEQLDARPASAATDLWAAAVVIREAITGRRPFEGDDPIEVAHAVRSTPLAPLLQVQPDADAVLAAVLDRALAFDPALRFGSAVEMLAAIEGRASIVAPPPDAPVIVATHAAPPHGSVAAVDEPDAPTRRRVAAVVLSAVVGAVGLGALLVALVVGTVMMVTGDDGDQGPATTAPPPTAASTASTDAPTTGEEAEEVPAQPTEPTTSTPARTEAEPDDDEASEEGGAPAPPTTDRPADKPPGG